jgi:Zn-dependent peptidase ImmA (M78 family)/transcriptional regulator with XRE-family HTH domain
MRPGTPGFIGARLRAAREARGLTASSLADLIGVTRAAVSQYENGQQSPSPLVLQQISLKLNLPSHHFLRPLPSNGGVIFYRSLTSATKGARAKAEQRYAWLREIVQYLRRYVKFPPVNVPEFRSAKHPASIDDNSIEKFAKETRRHWSLGDEPITNVSWLLEKQGIVTARQELDSPKLDAFSHWCAADGVPYVVLNSEKASAVRSRFDAAHELAHLALHRQVGPSVFSNRSTFSLIEEQANRFSGALLLPEEPFAEDVYAPTLDAFRALKPKWRVSVGVMIKRAAQIGMVSKEAEQRLWINYSRRGWRQREPLDNELQPELPQFLRRCVELLVSKGVVVRHDLPFQLALFASDLESLIGLERGYFDAPVDGALEPEFPAIIPFPSSE